MFLVSSFAVHNEFLFGLRVTQHFYIVYLVWLLGLNYSVNALVFETLICFELASYIN